LDETFRIVFRSAHILGAALWLGGVALGALLTRRAPQSEWQGTYWAGFRNVATWAVWTMIISGVALLFDRLSYPAAASPLYVGLLGGKITLALALLGVSLSVARRSAASSLSVSHPQPGTRALQVLVWLGTVLFVLGAALTVSYERELRLAS
jgi:hypothetical protein